MSSKDTKQTVSTSNSEPSFTVIKTTVEKPDLREKEKPLVDLKVTNPVTYIKSWWKKIIGNEGIELKLKIKPLTAIALAVIAITLTMGIGRIVLPFNIPFFEYTTNDVPLFQNIVSETQNVPRDTAFAGTLKFDIVKNRFYLFTATSEAINLTTPTNIDLKEFIGRRIFAAGKYDENSRTLLVETASDMEILPTKIVSIPTESPTPTTLPELSPIPNL